MVAGWGRARWSFFPPNDVGWMYQPLGSQEPDRLDPCALVVAVDTTHSAVEVLAHPCEHVDLHAALQTNKSKQTMIKAAIYVSTSTILMGDIWSFN